MVSGGGSERQLLLSLIVNSADATAQLSAYNAAGKETVSTNASIAGSTDPARMSMDEYAKMVGGATSQNQAYATSAAGLTNANAAQATATRDLTIDFQALVSAQRETVAAQAQVAQATEAAMSGQLSEEQSTTLLSSAFTRLSAAQAEQSASAKAVIADSNAMGGSFATTTAQANALAASVATESDANDVAAGSSSRLTAVLGTIGLALAAVTVASGAFAVKEAADFQSTTADIANFGNVSVAQADAIGQGLDHNFNLGTDSAATLREALSQNIGVLDQVAGGTVTTAQAEQVMAAAQNLATVGNQSLDSSTKAVSTTLRTFGLDVTDAAHVSDLLFNSQTKTGQGADQTTAAWGRMKEMLGVLNPSIDDIAALTDRASEAGLNGTRAITGLASGWDHLYSQSPAVIQALKDYGISLYDNTGKALGFDTVGAEYIARQAGMTDAQKVAMDAVLMGGQAFQKSWDILAAGETPLQMVQSELGGIASVSDQAMQKTGTLSGQWDQLKAVGADLAITVGVTLVDAFANLIKYQDEEIVKLGQFATSIGTWQTGITAVDNELKKVGASMQSYGATDLAQTTEFQKQFNNAVEASNYPTDALSTHLSQGGDGLRKYGAEAVAAGAGTDVLAESAKQAAKALSDSNKAYDDETKAQQADLEGKTALAAAYREEAAAETSGDATRIAAAGRQVALAQTTTSQVGSSLKTQVSDANTAATDMRTASELIAKGKQDEADGYTQAAALESAGDKQGALDAIAAGKEKQTAADDAAKAQIESAKAVTTAVKSEAADQRAANADLFTYIKTETMNLPASWRAGLAGAEAAVQQANAAILADDQALASGLQGDALKTAQEKRTTDADSLTSAKSAYSDQAAASSSMNTAIQESDKAATEQAAALRASDLSDTIAKNQQKLASELNTIAQARQAQMATAATDSQVAQITAGMYMTEAAQATDSATKQKDIIEANLTLQVAAIKQAESDKIAAIQKSEETQLTNLNKALLVAQEQVQEDKAYQLQLQADADEAKANIDIALAGIQIDLTNQVMSAQVGASTTTANAAIASADVQVSATTNVASASVAANRIQVAGAQEVGAATTQTANVIGTSIPSAFGAATSASTTFASTTVAGYESVIAANQAYLQQLTGPYEQANLAAENAASKRVTEIEGSITSLQTSSTNSITAVSQSADNQLAILQAKAQAALGTIQAVGAAASSAGAGGSQTSDIGSMLPTGSNSGGISASQLGFGTETVGGNNGFVAAAAATASATTSAVTATTTAIATQTTVVSANQVALQTNVDTETKLKDAVAVTTENASAQLAVLKQQSSVLSDQLSLTNDQLAANGQTSSTDAALLALQVQRDQATLTGASTTEIDKQISQEQARNQLASDQNALSKVGLTLNQAQNKVQQDQNQLVIDQAAAQANVNSTLDGTLAKLQLELTLQQSIDKLASGASGGSTGAVSNTPTGAGGLNTSQLYMATGANGQPTDYSYDPTAGTWWESSGVGASRVGVGDFAPPSDAMPAQFVIGANGQGSFQPLSVSPFASSLSSPSVASMLPSTNQPIPVVVINQLTPTGIGGMASQTQYQQQTLTGGQVGFGY